MSRKLQKSSKNQTITQQFDQHIYGDNRDQFVNTIVEENAGDDIISTKNLANKSLTQSRKLIRGLKKQAIGTEFAPVLSKRKVKPLSDKYRERGKGKRMLSPERHEALGADVTPNINARTYKEIMRGQRLEKERQTIALKQQQNRKEITDKRKNRDRKKYRIAEHKNSEITTDIDSKSDLQSKWDQTPNIQKERINSETPSQGRWLEPTPLNKPTSRTHQKRPTNWDQQTPLQSTANSQFLYTPQSVLQSTPQFGTPSLSNQITDQMKQVLRWQYDMDQRNKPYTDEELNQILPTNGYEIIEPPPGYVKIRRVTNRAITPASQRTPMYNIPDSISKPVQIPTLPMDGSGEMPSIKPEDIAYFGKLLNQVNEEDLTLQEQKDRKIMMLLLKIKNGTPPMRKSALRQITDKAREFDAGPLFNQILPLLMSSTLEDQERHLLVKVIDRVMYKLDELVRPYVHKILVVIEPLLIDKDYYARVEGREIISNLAKAAGLNTMITTMRPDIDHSDEFVRNTTARAFAVVASALGIPALLPFLKAVCKSKKSWQAKHTGIKIIQQIAILLGCAVLPHLRNLVDIMKHGLKDEQQKVRTITALALAALAEASTPYGIEAFKMVLIPLWEGIQRHRGKGLAAFLKAIGFIIPLMDSWHANLYTKETMKILKRQFKTSEEEMKKIVLKVVKQCVSTEGVEAKFVREDIMQEFFDNFWIRQMALDKRNYRQLVDTTVEIAIKVGGADIISAIVIDLKDENEPYRKMVMETIEKIIVTLGVSDINQELENQLMEGILHAFHEHTSEDTIVMLNGFGAVVNCLGVRTKPYFSKICGMISWRLNNKSAKIRQQAADLITRIALVMKKCDETVRLGKLGSLLFECLGEEYPEVLGSILGGLKAIVNVVGMERMTPPIKDLLPRLTPILKNRHEKVQENCIDLVGRIADRGSEYVNAKEWMRICFDLLDLLKAHKKGIRRATVNTFGYIAKAIGPQDVLYTLLNNLKVQERQNRVCTTVAIAIVAETCGPFTVLPALMNEYRVPELNVQNGVLKSLCFMFEYIGEMGKDYIYAVTPLLEDALTDRDLVHRQTAASAVKHLALGVQGLQCEDALVHLLNYVWPNIFESSPHVIQAVQGAIEGMRVSLGPGNVLLYTLQGLYHPARRVRNVYWKVYNMLYIGSQDAMNAYYPPLENEPENDYTRHELNFFV